MAANRVDILIDEVKFNWLELSKLFYGFNSWRLNSNSN